jgi:hypothetical protein
MNIKTSELAGAALDWAVAIAEDFNTETLNTKTGVVYSLRYGVYTPSTNWAQGGPIIEREGIGINSHLDGDEWFARDYWGMNEQADEKPLIAAMRCYVASKLGDTVDVPEELV